MREQPHEAGQGPRLVAGQADPQHSVAVGRTYPFRVDVVGQVDSAPEAAAQPFAAVHTDLVVALEHVVRALARQSQHTTVERDVDLGSVDPRCEGEDLHTGRRIPDVDRWIRAPCHRANARRLARDAENTFQLSL